MPYWMIFRAETPPSFNMHEYRKHSREPIRFDAVTVVEADTSDEAVKTLIGSTGLIVTSFAACEVALHSFQSRPELDDSGVLRAKPKELTNGDTTAGD